MNRRASRPGRHPGPRAILALALVLLALPAAAAGKAPRYGLLAKLLAYDPAARQVRVRVVETQIPDALNAVGKRPPREVRIGMELELAVEPEGSVLRRTVIKSTRGGSLDSTGTAEGFRKALAALPEGRALGFSITPIEGAKAGAPAWKAVLIVIPLTREEILKRFEELSTEE